MKAKLSPSLVVTLALPLLVGCWSSASPPAPAQPAISQSSEPPPTVTPIADPTESGGEASLVGKKTGSLVGAHDWNQWGGSSARNNTPEAKNLPDSWEMPKFKDDGNWEPGTGKNIKWAARLGSQSYGNPVVANGQVYVGTNNMAGYVKKYPPNVDLGCLLCFGEKDGEFLWQHSNEKLAAGRVQDWEQQGVCATPIVEGDRLWYVSNRGVVNCLDTHGFHDGVNNGPYKDEPRDLRGKTDADVIWQYDMMAKLGLFQHNMCASSATIVGDLLFLITGNGVDDSHVAIPAPTCPAFICLDKNTGEYYWGDASPGLNILHGQWSSPAYGVFAGVPVVMFAGGDGWLHAFRADKGKDGKPESLWKCDLNPKRSKWILGGRGTRNEVISTPVMYKDRIFICVGQDPEHGEGEGHLWCINPVKKGDNGPELRRGDISPELVLDDKGNVIPHRRIQAADSGDVLKANPNSGVDWHYGKFDQNGDGKIDFTEELHRSIGTATIKDDILYLADFSGVFHCVDAKTGKPYWTHDMLSGCWGSALVADGKVYIGNEDGDVLVFAHSSDRDKAMHKGDDGNHQPIHKINMGNSVYTTPVAANDRLFIATQRYLFCISQDAKQPRRDAPEPVSGKGPSGAAPKGGSGVPPATTPP